MQTQEPIALPEQLSSLIDEILSDWEEHLYFGSPKHKKVMEISELLDTETLGLAALARLIEYLQIYISETAPQASLMTDLPYRAYFTTFLKMRDPAKPRPPVKGTIQEEIDFKTHRGRRLREDFYAAEIGFINKSKHHFDYSQEIFSAIDTACFALFENLRNSGWLDFSHRLWQNGNDQTKIQLLHDFLGYIDAEFQKAGIPFYKMEIVMDDNPNSTTSGAASFKQKEDYDFILLLKLNEPYALDKNSKMQDVFAAVLHERIHGVFDGMALDFEKHCKKDTPKPAYINDAVMAYFRQRYSLTSGTSDIKSLYPSDHEEVICHGHDYEFSGKCMWYFYEQAERQHTALPAPSHSL